MNLTGKANKPPPPPKTTTMTVKVTESMTAVKTVANALPIVKKPRKNAKAIQIELIQNLVNMMANAIGDQEKEKNAENKLATTMFMVKKTMEKVPLMMTVKAPTTMTVKVRKKKDHASKNAGNATDATKECRKNVLVSASAITMIKNAGTIAQNVTMKETVKVIALTAINSMKKIDHADKNARSAINSGITVSMNVMINASLAKMKVMMEREKLAGKIAVVVMKVARSRAINSAALAKHAMKTCGTDLQPIRSF